MLVELQENPLILSLSHAVSDEIEFVLRLILGSREIALEYLLKLKALYNLLRRNILMKLLERKTKRVFRRMDKHFDWYWPWWLIAIGIIDVIGVYLIFLQRCRQSTAKSVPR